MEIVMRPIAAAALLLSLALPAAGALPQPSEAAVRGQRMQEPSLTVNGDGEVSVRPDRATIRLGAVAQADQASLAQEQVNGAMQAAIDSIMALGVPESAISTASISLQPVYSQPPRNQNGPFEPKIVGFRASNTLQIRVENLDRVGPVVDAGINAGVNQLEGITFDLRDETEARSAALKKAVQSARAKARAIAEAMEVRLASVAEVTEGHADVFMPRYGAEMRMAPAAMDMATPVQPGEVQIRASVTIRYRLAETDLRE